MDKMQHLLAKGYLPPTLPPPFTSQMFGSRSRKILAAWKRSGIISQKPWQPEAVFKVKETIPIVYSCPKGNLERRFFHIIHPYSQLILSYVISYYWRKISDFLSDGKYSLDKIEFVEDEERALRKFDFQRHSVHKLILQSTANVIVKTDISRFYPSIYTHSIPWAMYGKENVKSNRKKYDREIGGLLDVLVRRCNQNQTIGIPVGPDTSIIIADIISNAIEVEFTSSAQASSLSADRVQDDWFIACPDMSCAERALSDLQRIYAKYGLEINGSKTNIESVKSFVEAPWLGRVRNLLSNRDLSKIRTSEFQAIASELLFTASQNPKERVLRYFFRSIVNASLPDAVMPALVAFSMQALAVDPRDIDIIGQLLINWRFHKRPLDTGLVAKRIFSLLEDALNKRHDFEAAWCLFICKGLSIKIDNKNLLDLIARYDGYVIPLLALDLMEREQIASLDTTYWESIIDKGDEFDELWLLRYEALDRGWLKAKKTAPLTWPMYKALKENKIRFYDHKKNVEKIEKTRKRLRRSSSLTKTWFSFFGSIPSGIEI
ncbi:MAG: RNA-directed DNA polymerase [Acetobacteraceae bacterium]|nr:RNA-directed DNA polymerase [Acetobacteraceae bacterium]